MSHADVRRDSNPVFWQRMDMAPPLNITFYTMTTRTRTTATTTLCKSKVLVHDLHINLELKWWRGSTRKILCGQPPTRHIRCPTLTSVDVLAAHWARVPHPWTIIIIPHSLTCRSADISRNTVPRFRPEWPAIPSRPF